MFVDILNRLRIKMKERRDSYKAYYDSLSETNKAREDNLLMAISVGVGII